MDINPSDDVLNPRTTLPVGRVDVAFRYMAVFAGMAAFGSTGVPSLLWALIYLMTLMFVALRFSVMLPVITRNTPLILFPIMCWVSVLWSVDRGSTITYSVMLTVTYLAALQIGMTTSPRKVLRTVSLVLIFGMLCSAVNYFEIFSNPWDHRGNFQGVYASKNTIGHVMVLLILISLYEIFRLRSGRFGTRLLWILVAAVAGVQVLLADSAASLATGFLFGSMLVISLFALRIGFRPLFVAGATLLLASGFLLALAIIQTPLNELFFDLLQRDATMTGRTVIWDVGWTTYAERPLLGYGANTFWGWGRTANIVAILQAQYGEGMHGFHNLIIEILVMVGPIGLAAFAIGFLFMFYRAISALSGLDPEIALLTLAILGFLLVIAMIDIALYKEHSLMTMLPIILCVSLGEMRERESRSRSL
ncbi:O-antigen ligase family protein [Rhodobacteraceae bacterium]|nr:O-antigen ligase family protein [Paracoccaceae bacterium]